MPSEVGPTHLGQSDKKARPPVVCILSIPDTRTHRCAQYKTKPICFQEQTQRFDKNSGSWGEIKQPLTRKCYHTHGQVESNLGLPLTLVQHCLSNFSHAEVKIGTFTAAALLKTLAQTAA